MGHTMFVRVLLPLRAHLQTDEAREGGRVNPL